MRCLEFYSGLGGMHFALKQSCPDVEVISAFDINTVANDVYQHNHGKRPYQGNIEKLSVGQLESYRADLWLLAPPCQPYTRRGLQKDADDWRASSFMQLLLKLRQMQAPPSHLLVENVVGFERSRTRTQMMQTMQAAGYAVQEFVISPVQLGVPYSRPRYFAVMKKSSSQGTDATADFPLQSLAGGAPFTEPPLRVLQQAKQVQGIAPTQPPPTALPVQPVRGFLETFLPCDTATQHTDAAHKSLLRGTEPIPDKEAQDPAKDADVSHAVARDVLEKWGHVLDIVTPDSCLINCFTKTYTRFAKGCGSVLATQNLDTISFEWSTQQRCSTSQAFIKPRLIARPSHAQHSQHSKHAQHLPTCAARDYQLSSISVVPEPAAELAEPSEALSPAVADRQQTKAAQGTTCQAQCSHGAKSFGADTGRIAAGGSSGSPHVQPIEGLHVSGSTRVQADKSSSCDMGCSSRDQDTSVSTHSGCVAECAEQAKLQDAAGEPDGITDNSISEAAALLCWLEGLQLRYFTPREVANLHSFPDSFSFPAHVTRRQQYALLGNSLSVAVVADLLKYMLKN